MAAIFSPQAHAVKRLMASAERLVVLTGAGISTDSGIPDYRSPGRPPHRPTNHSEFMRSEAARLRYWARSMIGALPRFWQQLFVHSFSLSLSLSSALVVAAGVAHTRKVTLSSPKLSQTPRTLCWRASSTKQAACIALSHRY
jgi:hypothetical protein